jgi:hypothetical protein
MRSLQSMTSVPVLVEAPDANDKLPVAVVFTTVPATLAALREAASLADKLNARITLMVPQVVPFPAPLECPPVLREFNEHRFRVLARDVQIEMHVHISLCRDRFEELRLLLPASSIVVLGGHSRRFLPGRDARLAIRLKQAGYEVIFKETE